MNTFEVYNNPDNFHTINGYTYVGFNGVPTYGLCLLSDELCASVLPPLDIYEENKDFSWQYFQEGLEALARLHEEAPLSAWAGILSKSKDYIATGYRWGWFWRPDVHLALGFRPILQQG